MACHRFEWSARAAAAHCRRARTAAIGLGMLTVLGVVAVLVAAAAFWWLGLTAESQDGQELYETARRGNFHLEITESGEIESTGNTELRCEVKSNNTAGTAILRLVPEGTLVEPGDFLVELDSSALTDERTQQQIAVNTSEALLVQARNEYETALIEKREYLEGTFKQEKEIIESEIFVAEENLRRDKEFLQYSRRLAAKGYVTQLQLEADAFAVEKSKKELDAAQTKLEVLERFTREKMVKQLESGIVSAKARWEAEKSSHELETGKLKDIEEQIVKCTIVAPRAGQVTYAHKHSWHDEVLIEEGAMVRERQVLVRLPDSSRMQVRIEVNESVVDRVEVGMRASVRPVGRDDITLPGTVTRVNEYSEPASRWEGNIKNYAAFIRLDETDDLLRTGMTAEVTVHCQDIPDVLQVPVQAVYAHGPELTFCFVQKGDAWEQRRIGVGPTNDSFVIIEKGLSENELVSLDPRRHLDTADLPELSAQELQQAVRPGPRLEAAEGAGQLAGEQPTRPVGTRPKAAEIIAQMDKDKDGVLAADELPEDMRSRFEAADTNGNGTLDRGELQAVLRLLGSGGQAGAAASGGGG